MTDNMFDKFVREKLKDHQSDVPNGLWEKIEQRKDKDRKGGLLPKNVLWAGLFFLLTIAGIGYIVFQENNDLKPISQFDEIPANGNSSSDLNADHEKTLKNTEESTNSSVGANNEIGGESENKNNDTNPSDGLNKNATTASSTYIDAKPGNSTSDKYIQNYSIISSRKKNTKKNSFTVAGKKNITHEIDLVKQQTNIEGSTPGESQETYVPFIKGKTAYNLTSLGKFDADKNYNLSDLKIVGIDCPPNSRQGRNDWYFEVYGSPDMAFKSVKATSNAGYVLKKDSSETQQLSYTAGFRISRSIGENLLIKTGLQYSQINERFDLRTENERRITTVITIRTIIGQNGADSAVRDTTSVEEIGYRLQRTYNRYRSIDIPLLLSYEFGNENLRFAVNAGAIINLRSWYSGNTLNDSLAVVSIDSKSSDLYKQNIGVGLYAGLSIIKPVSNRFDVFMEPHFRYNFTNMSKTAGYSQRFNAAGISFGIRYRINRQRSGIN